MTAGEFARDGSREKRSPGSRGRERSRRQGIACALLLLAVCGCGTSEELESPGQAKVVPGREAEARAVPRSHPLLVVGLDAASWDQIDPMIARGELPNLAALVARGTRATLVCLPPLNSAVAWTTYATGRFGRDHQVLDHTFPYVPGPKRPVPSSVRREPALWNIASHYGRRVGVIGYYATHPPEVVNGVMVSSRAAAGAPGATYPPDALAGAADALAELEDPEEIRRLQARFLPWDYDPTARARPDDPYHRVTKVVNGRVDQRILYDEYVRRAALHVAERPFDLFISYLRIVDHTGHAAWLYQEPEAFEEAPDPGDVALLRDLIPAAYRYVDEALGELVAKFGPEANVVVISDHGQGAAAGKWAIHREKLEFLTGNHRPDGIFLAAGPDIRPGRLEGLTNVDVTPILLALLRLPLSDELPGRLEEAVFRDGFLEREPLARVPAYEIDWQTVAARASEAVDREDLEALKALGYVDLDAATPDAAAAEPPADVDFWSIELRLRRSEITGEALYHLVRGDVERAVGVLREVEENDPELFEILHRTVRGYRNLWEQELGLRLFPEETLRAFESAVWGPPTAPRAEPAATPAAEPARRP